MKRLLAAGLVLTLLALANAPPANAFHGSFYVARGPATLATGETFDAVLRWSGQQLLGGEGTMTVDLFDRATGQRVHQNSVPSLEDVSHVHFVGCVEFVDPYALVSVAGPAVLLLTGIMRNDLCTFTATDDFAGPYLTAFSLDVHVRGFEHG